MTGYEFVQLLAIDSDKFIDIYKKYSDLFSNFSVLKDILRTLGWMLIKGLIKLSGIMNTLVDSAFDFLNFMKSDSFSGLYNNLRPFVWTVFFIGLIYLAYCYIFAHERPKGTITNVLLFMGTLTLLPYMMTQMTNMVTYAKDMLSENVASEKYELLSPYITDLVYLDSIDFKDSEINKGKINGYTSTNYEAIEYLDVNEVVDPSDYSLVNKDLFNKQLTSEVVKKKGKSKTVELKVGKIKKSKFFFKDTTPYYYRYHINFFVAVLYLLAMIIVMAFSSIKLIHLVYELAVEKILVPFIAAGDLTNGQKIRKALIGILNGYITIVCVLFLQKLFVVSCSYINSVKWSENGAANGLTKSLFIVAGALFIVDGPNFFEQIFGIDAGLKSVGQAMQSAYYSSQMLSALKGGVSAKTSKVSSAVKGMGNNLKSGAIGAANTAAGAAGLYAGMKDTGILESQNEKISGRMAKNNGHSPEKESVNEGIQNRMKSPLTEDNIPHPDEADMTEEAVNNLKSASTLANNSVRENTSISDKENANAILGSNGKDNLQNNNQEIGNSMKAQNPLSDNSVDMLNMADSIPEQNDYMNKALNNSEISGRKDPGDNLIDWAKGNTRTGKMLTGNYEKGKSLGHAIGNTVNKTSLNNNDAKLNEQLSKDNLRK